MATWGVVLGAVATIFLTVGVGAFARRREWLTAEADRSLMDVTVRVLMPCLNLRATMASPALQQHENLLWPPLLGMASLILGIGLAWLGTRLWSTSLGLVDDRMRRTFAYASGTFNYGYIPIPLVALLFDPDTLAVLVVFMVGVELGVWTLGVLVLTGSVGRSALWRLVNPPSVAVAVGVTLNLTGVAALVPAVAQDVVALLANAAVPVGLLLVGAMMADHIHEARRSAGLRAAIGACVLRGLLAPLVLTWIAANGPFTVELRHVLVVEAAMPAAMFSLVITRYYGGHGPTALRVVLATSLVALVSIPAWITWGLAQLPSG